MSKIIGKDDLPTVCVNLLTYNRTEYATACVKKCLDNLRYDGPLVWYVSDGGSGESHLHALRDILEPSWVADWHSQKVSAGENWNMGIRSILDSGLDIYLRLEDDMVLKSRLDITDYVKLFMVREDIGMIRLGQIIIDLDLFTFKEKRYTHVGYEEDVYLEVKKTKPFVFCGHPALIHRRFHDAYGYFPDGPSAGECEVQMDRQVHLLEGPKVVFPYDMARFGTWGVWDHVGKDKA